MLRTMRIAVALFALGFGLFTGPQAWASASASGTFTASQSCEAYVSKNKRTNPDDAAVTAGEQYPVFEVNKADSPTWFRLIVAHANPPERWVDTHCGTVADLQIGGGTPFGGSGSGGTGGQPNACSTAGLADSYVLALSWQPGFCEEHRDKPECHIDDPKAYQAGNFTLHGLWPNKQSCGTGYGYCGEVQDKPGEFCDYPALQLFTVVRDELGEVMPSAAAGSCLQRHEWHKHGTCQTQWSVDQYYEVAIDLTQQFNAAGLGYFMSRRVGEEVSEADFFARVDCALGEGAHERLQLGCKNGNLVDVYINLPEEIEPDKDLGDLVLQADPKFRSNCGGSFRVDPIGFMH